MPVQRRRQKERSLRGQTVPGLNPRPIASCVNQTPSLHSPAFEDEGVPCLALREGSLHASCCAPNSDHRVSEREGQTPRDEWDGASQTVTRAPALGPGVQP